MRLCLIFPPCADITLLLFGRGSVYYLLITV